MACFLMAWTGFAALPGKRNGQAAQQAWRLLENNEIGGWPRLSAWRLVMDLRLPQGRGVLPGLPWLVNAVGKDQSILTMG